MDISQLLTYGGIAIALVLVLVMVIFGIRVFGRIEQAEREVWRDKQARRDRQQKLKQEIRTEAAARRVIELQIQEQQLIRELQARDQAGFENDDVAGDQEELAGDLDEQSIVRPIVWETARLVKASRDQDEASVEPQEDNPQPKRQRSAGT